MAESRKHIDSLLSNWEYEPESVLARIVQGEDGRDVVQVRIDMGVMQMEETNRPDGKRPHGFPTYLAYVKDLAARADENFALDVVHCGEIDREFVQFYHRRISWLQLRKFDFAARDATHTIELMDFCRDYSPDDQWTIAHEQYRPFVIFHKTQAEALASLETDAGAAHAVECINGGLAELQTVFDDYEASEQFHEDELVKRLIEMREDLRTRFEIGRTLNERLSDAVASEKYELAAQLRDQLAAKDIKSPEPLLDDNEGESRGH